MTSIHFLVNFPGRFDFVTLCDFKVEFRKLPVGQWRPFISIGESVSSEAITIACQAPVSHLNAHGGRFDVDKLSVQQLHVDKLVNYLLRT